MSHRPKRIEVALPLDASNAASAREKLIHIGPPSNLHAWWARHPLAAFRAVIFASLVDDPGADLPRLEARERQRELFNPIERLVQCERGKAREVRDEASLECLVATT